MAHHKQSALHGIASGENEEEEGNMAETINRLVREQKQKIAEPPPEPRGKRAKRNLEIIKRAKHLAETAEYEVEGKENGFRTRNSILASNGDPYMIGKEEGRVDYHLKFCHDKSCLFLFREITWSKGLDERKQARARNIQTLWIPYSSIVYISEEIDTFMYENEKGNLERIHYNKTIAHTEMPGHEEITLVTYFTSNYGSPQVEFYEWMKKLRTKTRYGDLQS